MENASIREEAVRERLDIVRDRIIAGGGDPEKVRIVAVTKGFGPEAVEVALAVGLHDIGENYADELVAKAERYSLVPSISWHYLGAIQRNKISRLVPYVSLFESVDRLEVGRALSTRRPGASILVEVNTTTIPGRPGVKSDEVEHLVVELARLELDVRGLMTVAAPDDEAQARATFSCVARLRDELGLAEASMGMSGDLEIAVRAGATMIRVGEALFGPRPARGQMSQ